MFALSFQLSDFRFSYYLGFDKQKTRYELSGYLSETSGALLLTHSSGYVWTLCLYCKNEGTKKADFRQRIAPLRYFDMAKVETFLIRPTKIFIFFDFFSKSQ